MSIVERLNTAADNLEAAPLNAGAPERDGLLDTISESATRIREYVVGTAIFSGDRPQKVGAEFTLGLKNALDSAKASLEEARAVDLRRQPIAEVAVLESKLKTDRRAVRTALLEMQGAYLENILQELNAKKASLENRALAEPRANTVLNTLNSITTRTREPALLNENDMADLERRVNDLREKIGALPEGDEVVWDNIAMIRRILRGESTMLLSNVSIDDLLKLKELQGDQVSLTSAQPN